MSKRPKDRPGHDPRRQYDRGPWRERGLQLELGGEGGEGAQAETEPAGGRGGESGDVLMPLEALSTEQLTRELKRRQGMLRQLVSRRNHLLRQLKELDARIADLGGPSEAGLAGSARSKGAVEDSPRRTRARNAISLPEAIAMAVEVRATITPTEAARLVLHNGYRSTSKNFGMMVANALAKDSRFKRVSRGIYARVS